MSLWFINRKCYAYKAWNYKVRNNIQKSSGDIFIMSGIVSKFTWKDWQKP